MFLQQRINNFKKPKPISYSVKPIYHSQFILQGQTAQTSNLFEIRNACGQVLFAVEADGTVYCPKGIKQ